jgi:antitoxin component YwqK of YwqJK toxin-antitoxin module
MLKIKRFAFVLVFFACFFTSKSFNAQKTNQFNEKKQRTGFWIKYHKNNKVRYTGAFENGKEIGVFKFYDISSSKNPVIIKTYSKQNDAVLVAFYTISGKLQSKGYFLNKNRIGHWVYYFLDGKKMSEEFYIEGKLDGKLINYYPNGKATEISLYKNGFMDGVSKKYSSKGILIEEINFKNGKPNGIAKYFELNGMIKETGSYKDGKRVGEWEYYLDGEVASGEDLKKKKKKFQKKND